MIKNYNDMFCSLTEAVAFCHGLGAGITGCLIYNEETGDILKSDNIDEKMEYLVTKIEFEPCFKIFVSTVPVGEKKDIVQFHGDLHLNSNLAEKYNTIKQEYDKNWVQPTEEDDDTPRYRVPWEYGTYFMKI